MSHSQSSMRSSAPFITSTPRKRRKMSLVCLCFRRGKWRGKVGSGSRRMILGGVMESLAIELMDRMRRCWMRVNNRNFNSLGRRTRSSLRSIINRTQTLPITFQPKHHTKIKSACLKAITNQRQTTNLLQTITTTNQPQTIKHLPPITYNPKLQENKLVS